MFLYTNIIVVFLVLDIMESPAFKKFGDLLENLFEFDDECDVPSFHDLGKLCVLCSLVILGHYLFFLEPFVIITLLLSHLCLVYM